MANENSVFRPFFALDGNEKEKGLAGTLAFIYELMWINFEQSNQQSHMMFEPNG